MDLDEIARKLHEGRMVARGKPRKATIQGLVGYVVKPGEILGGPFVVLSATRVDDPSGDLWEAEVVRLVDVDTSSRSSGPTG